MLQPGFWNAMNAGALFHRFSMDNVVFWLDGNELCFHPANKITPDVEKQIRKHGRLLVAIAPKKYPHGRVVQVGFLELCATLDRLNL